MRHLLLLLVVLWVAGCSFVSSGEVFSFADHDLCERVSEDEVASFVSEAYDKLGVEWDGSVVAVPPDGSAWDVSGDYSETPGDEKPTDVCRSVAHSMKRAATIAPPSSPGRNTRSGCSVLPTAFSMRWAGTPRRTHFGTAPHLGVQRLC